MDASFLVRPEVKWIPPYNAGLTATEVQSRYRPDRIVKLGSNENPLGPSPNATDIGTEIREMMRIYPDPQGRELKRKIAEEFDIKSEQVILGNGSEDLIAIICRAVVRASDPVLTLYPSFPLHEDYAVLMGGTVTRAHLREDFTVDVDRFCQELSKKPRLAIFSNPMNPVGVALTLAELETIFAHTSPETLLVVDEAYFEYLDGNGYGSAALLFEKSKLNLIVLRTFSKAYGLAGLRVGYGIASDPVLAHYLDRVRTPFNVNAVAQHVAARALEDKQHLGKVVNLALTERKRMSEALADIGFRIAPSKGNFLFFDCGVESSEISELLLARGVIIKPWRQNGYTRHIRVSLGAADENTRFLQAIKAVQNELQESIR